MAIIRLEEQTGYKDWLKNTNNSWQHDTSIQATTDENPFIYLTNTGEDDAVFQIALSKLVDIQLIRKNSILVTPFILDKAKGIKIELRDQSQNTLATSKASLNSKTWIHLLANAEDIALDITELWITFVLPAGASTVIAGIQGQILTQDQTVVDSIKVEATDQDTAIDLTQAKLDTSKYFVKFASENWWRADGVLKAKQLWLPFNQVPILVNGQNMMYRTFYVDAVNGDNDNDGSESAPFKTISKAIDSVPHGGIGIIILTAGQTIDINYDIICEGKYIRIQGNRNNHAVLNFQSYVTAYGNAVYQFQLRRNGLLEFDGVDFNLPLKADSEQGWYLPSAIRNVGYSYGSVFHLRFTYCDIDLNTDGCSLIHNNGSFSITNSFMGCSITTHSAGFVIRNGSSLAGLLWVAGGSIDDDDYWVSNIIKDANGVPRNIVSNIVF